MRSIIDDNPLASYVFAFVLVVSAAAYFLGDITFWEFAGLGVGANGVGSAAIGEVRNRAGKGKD